MDVFRAALNLGFSSECGPVSRAEAAEATAVCKQGVLTCVSKQTNKIVTLK